MTAPIHQNSALPTRGLPMTAPTLPFIARCTVSTTPRNTVSAYTYDSHRTLLVSPGNPRLRGSGSCRARGGSEETDHLHLLAAGVVQHVHGAPRKQHGRALRVTAAPRLPTSTRPEPVDDVDHFFAVRVRVRRRDLFAGRDANHARRAVVRLDGIVRHQPAQLPARQPELFDVVFVNRWHASSRTSRVQARP